MKDTILTDHIFQLVELSKTVIAKMSEEMVIRFELQPIQEKIVEGFIYDENGVTYERSSHPFKQIKNWTKSCFDAYYLIAPSEPFLALDNLVKEKYPSPYQSNIVKQYAFKLFHILFKIEGADSEKAISELSVAFFQQITDKPHNVKGTAYLNGIILENNIQIAERCLLRKTVQRDLELPKNAINDSYHLPLPSAVLEMEMQLTEKQHGLFQEKIMGFVLLIRLFDVGSISYNYYEMQFDVITGGHISTGSPHGFLFPWRKYFLKATEEKRFIYFINHFIKYKDLLNSHKGVNHINIAFDRYSEALLENVSIERRIANAVMGLEALLSTQNPEIKFSLSLRVGKLLSVFRVDPLSVKLFVGQAYNIRSKFAHGGHLTKEIKNKLEAEFNGIDNFTTTIFNYLRICIVIYIATGIAKKDLMKITDDALLDVTASEKLAAILEPVHQFLFNN
jgi:hypothetical protein